MADENKLLIEIEASTVAAVKAIDGLDTRLKDFGKTGTVSIQQLELALAEIKRAASEATDVNEIKRLGAEYRKVQTQLQGAEQAFYGVEDAARRSRIAVYGLNQVVRDLPFGFIAISNNIPVLTDQLQELYRVNNNKLLPTLKAFAAGLGGAAGIGIAISAVTSLVTYAIQEYGSLGNAVRALFGEYTELDAKLKKAQESLEKFNKELRTGSEITAAAQGDVGGDIEYYKSLAAIVLDVNNGYTKQNSALQLLQKANKEFFGDINNITQAKEILNKRVAEYTRLAEAETRVNAIKKEISATSQLIFSQEELLRQQKLQIAELEKLPKLVTGAGREIEVPELTKLREDANTTRAAIGQLYTTWSGYNATLENETNSLTDANRQLLNVLDQQNKAQQEKQTQQRIRTFILEREIKLLETSLETIGLQTDEYIKVKQRIIEIQGELKKIGEEDARIKAQIDIDTNLAIGQARRDIDDAILKLERSTPRYSVPVELKLKPDKKLKTQNDLKPLEQFRADILEKYQNGLPIPFALKQDEKSKKKYIADINEIINQQKRAYQDLGRFVGSTLNAGIQTFVEGLNDGISAADSLKNAFKAIANQLKEIIIKLAVIEGIKLLANIIQPGAGAKLGAGLSAALGVPDLTGLFGRPGQVARGLNVGSGGLALAGQVVFVQRGPDLVGVLGQANGRINRVG